MIRLGVWVNGLKNYKSETEPIIIGLVWFGSTLKMNDYPSRSEPIPLICFGSSGSLDQSDLLTPSPSTTTTISPPQSLATTTLPCLVHWEKGSLMLRFGQEEKSSLLMLPQVEVANVDAGGDIWGRWRWDERQRPDLGQSSARHDNCPSFSCATLGRVPMAATNNVEQ